MSDDEDNVIPVRRFETFIPSRGDVTHVMEGLSDLLTIMEATIIQERYGISVMFDQGGMRWEARDPRGHFIVFGNTPSAAIFLWDIERDKVEGKAR